MPPTVFTVCVVIAGHFADVFRSVREVAPGVPPCAAEAVYGVLPNFRHFDFKDRVAYGEAVPADVLAWVTVYGVAWIAIVLVLGLLSFRSRDFQ